MVARPSYSADEIRTVLEASLSLTSELSLDAVLKKVVNVAREQIGARYAALSVLNPDGHIGQFITDGISDDERAAIGPPPHGHGLLGVLLHEGTSLRLDDIGADPRSVGFPPNHPPMKSLLGVPVGARGQKLGNLYLTEKPGGFTERDEDLLHLLSAHAAVAIANARLYETERLRADQWKALFELSRQITFSSEPGPLLDSVVERATRLVDAELGLILLRSEGIALHIAAHQGLRTTPPLGALDVPPHGILQHILDTGERAIVLDRSMDPRMHGGPLLLLQEEGLHSSVEVPLKGKDEVFGILLVGNREQTVFTEQQAELLETFGNLTAAAIETRQLYDKLDSLARLEERERIGMDLHDGVIQSIYAVGLHLEDLADRLPESAAELRPDVERAMDDLNKVIKDIRSYIFDLRPQLSQVHDLPEALSQLAEQFRVNTLITIDLDIDEPFISAGGEAEAMAFFHIAQEALNNVSKHSKARLVNVTLTCAPLTLEIADNGVGFEVPGDDLPSYRNGLRNMRDRARSVGALLTYESTPGEGAKIRVRLPETRKEPVP
jgi:signal transduction histidine kinase